MEANGHFDIADAGDGTYSASFDNSVFGNSKILSLKKYHRIGSNRNDCQTGKAVLEANTIPIRIIRKTLLHWFNQ